MVYPLAIVSWLVQGVDSNPWCINRILQGNGGMAWNNLQDDGSEKLAYMSWRYTNISGAWVFKYSCVNDFQKIEL